MMGAPAARQVLDLFAMTALKQIEGPCRMAASGRTETEALPDSGHFGVRPLSSAATGGCRPILLNNSTFERRGIGASVKRKEDRWPGALYLCWRDCLAPIQSAIFAISGSAGHNHFAIRRRFCAVAASRNSS